MLANARRRARRSWTMRRKMRTRSRGDRSRRRGQARPTAGRSQSALKGRRGTCRRSRDCHRRAPPTPPSSPCSPAQAIRAGRRGRSPERRGCARGRGARGLRRHQRGAIAASARNCCEEALSFTRSTRARTARCAARQARCPRSGRRTEKEIEALRKEAAACEAAEDCGAAAMREAQRFIGAPPADPARRQGRSASQARRRAQAWPHGRGSGHRLPRRRSRRTWRVTAGDYRAHSRRRRRSAGERTRARTCGARSRRDCRVAARRAKGAASEGARSRSSRPPRTWWKDTSAAFATSASRRSPIAPRRSGNSCACRATSISAASSSKAAPGGGASR